MKKYDLAEEMSKQLQTESMEKTTHVNKIALALDCLNKAAELLDNMEEHQSSEIVTKVIERIAGPENDPSDLNELCEVTIRPKTGMASPQGKWKLDYFHKVGPNISMDPGINSIQARSDKNSLMYSYYKGQLFVEPSH